MENGILEGNKLIAEFMGYKFKKGDTLNGYRGVFRHPDKSPFVLDLNCPFHAKYHSSWTWLMPVVEKIQNIEITPPPNYRGYRFEIVVGGYVEISGFPMPRILVNVSNEGSLINAIYKAVLQFIKWYNENKK